MSFRAFSASPSPPIRLLQISDPHLVADKNKTFAGILPFKSLQAVLEDAKQHLPYDCILSTGDIAQESTAQTYQLYFDELHKLNLPHYWIKGNHDYSEDFPSQTPDDEPQVILIGQWCLILINSQVPHHVYGEIRPKHLDILDNLLKQYQDYFVLIALHHNTFAVGCAWLDPHGLKNTKAFLSCITPHANVRLVISGHVHQVFEYQHQHIQFLSCPSTCVQFKPNQDDFNLDTLTPGYRTLELYADGHYITQIHRLTQHIGEVDLNLSEY